MRDPSLAPDLVDLGTDRGTSTGPDVQRRRRALRYDPSWSPLKIRTTHPLVFLIFRHLNEQRMSMAYLAEKSGVGMETIRDWNRPTRRTHPQLHSLSNVLEVLGLELTIRRKL